MVSLKQPISVITKYFMVYFPAKLGKKENDLVFVSTPFPRFHLKAIIFLSSSKSTVLSFKVIESAIQCVVIISFSTLGGPATIKSKFTDCSPLHPSAVGLLAITSIL